MRRIIGSVLLGVGAFLLVAGLVAQVWAPGAVKKTPLNVDTTTHLAGTAEKLNPETGEVETLDVRATSITRIDSNASDEEVAVWVNNTCLVIDEGDVPDCVTGDDPRLINAASDVFATDRVTARAVVGGDYLPETAAEREGLVNKWPFDAERTDYQYWDGMLGEAVPAEFAGVEELDGLETYKYVVFVPETPAEVAEGIDGIYTARKEIWVEPQTGSIVKQTQEEQRTTTEGDLLLDLQLSFTDDQVAKSIGDTEDSVSQLSLVTDTVPLVGIVGGLVLIVAGAGVLLFGRRRQHRG